MAKRNTLNLDTRNFEELLTKLDELGGNLQKVVEDALNQAGETIENDTLDALNAANLPAKGKYSRGDTRKSVIRNPKTEWQGTTASIAVGFDYSKRGAGGLLITGTPKMKPDQALNKIYKNKRYMQQLENDMKSVVNDAIIAKMEG